MKIAVSIGTVTNTNIEALTRFIQCADALGVDSAWSHESWGSDAISPLAYFAGQTKRIKLGSGIAQISARAPTMMAMTALTLNALSRGRFLLGLGASGPQVVEGLHGVPYSGPLTRLKETVAIIQAGLRGEKIAFQGKFHELPRPGGEGKAIRLDFPPAAHIPLYLATLGPRALAYTGSVAHGWLGTTFSPAHAEAHLQYLRAGAAAAGRTLNDIDIQVACPVSIGEDVESLIAARKPGMAFTLGAMGSATTNFYNDAIRRAGYADDAIAIQRLWLAGKREAAALRVPDELVMAFGAIGTEAMVRERFAAYAAAGVDTLYVRLEHIAEARRCATLEQICALASADKT